jgi:hypothetical protein
LTTDHIGLVELLESLNTSFQTLRPGMTVDPLLEQLLHYQSAILPHLKEEEDIALPLMRAYFTLQEFKPITMKLVKRMTKAEMGAFIYFCGETKFRQQFMKQESIPFFVWYLQFRSCYKYYLNTTIKGLDAIKNGLRG